MLTKHFKCVFKNLLLLFKYLYIWLYWFLIVAHGIFNLSCSMWDLVPHQGSNLGSLYWEQRVLATSPPGKPLLSKHFFSFSLCSVIYSSSQYYTSLLKITVSLITIYYLGEKVKLILEV